MDRDAFASFERGINAVPSDIAMATARWATADEVTAHADAHPTGLLLGQLKFDSVDDTFQIRVDDNRHIILLAGTRAGKGVSIIIPNLLFEGERSVFVLDPKGENATLTCHRRGQSDLVTCTYRDGNKFYPIRLTRRNWRKMIAMEDTGMVELTEMLSRVFIPYYDNPKAEYWLDRYVRLEFVEYCMYTYRPANDNTTPMDWFTQMIIRF